MGISLMSIIVGALILAACQDLAGPLAQGQPKCCDTIPSLQRADSFPVPLIEGGGLYGAGMNEMPASHRLLGESIASSISRSGALVAALGQSVTAQTWTGLSSVLAPNEFDAKLAPTSCGGCTVVAWDNPRHEGWIKANRWLAQHGYSGQDIEVVWMEVTESQTQPPNADDLERILAVMKQEWPNVKLLFVSSRFYGGYRTHGKGEPAAWESGLAVREFVLDHLGETGPWIAWGPYLWANGSHPNSAGLTWEREDFTATDGLHLSHPIGQEKAGHLLEDFFLSNDPLVAWFRAD